MSLSQYTTVSLSVYYCVTLSVYYCVTLSVYYCVTLSILLCHSLSILLCHSLSVLLCHSQYTTVSLAQYTSVSLAQCIVQVLNWCAFNHASHAHQLRTCNYFVGCCGLPTLHDHLYHLCFEIWAFYISFGFKQLLSNYCVTLSVYYYIYVTVNMLLHHSQYTNMSLSVY